jgi:hypothetical protein
VTVTSYRACPNRASRVVWATTKNGKRQILDWTPNDDGNVAAYQDHAGGWHARTIGIQSDPVRPPEKVYMPHWASSPRCRPPSPQSRQAAREVVTFLDEYRRAQSAHNAAGRRRKPRQPPTAGYRLGGSK